MTDVINLAEALRKSNWPEAMQRLEQGEKIQKDLAAHDKRYIYDQLARAKQYDILLALAGNGSIDTDLYEYESLERSVFESIFRIIGNGPEALEFLTKFLGKFDNINDAVGDKTLLLLAFTLNVPLEAITVLVDAGCDPRYKNNYEENYLFNIVKEFNIKEDTGVKYLEYLMDQGLDPNDGNIVKETPLHIVVGNRKLKYWTCSWRGALIRINPVKTMNQLFTRPLFTRFVTYLCMKNLPGMRPLILTRLIRQAKH